MQLKILVCNIVSGGWKLRTADSCTRGLKLPDTLLYATNSPNGGVVIYFIGFCTIALIFV